MRKRRGRSSAQRTGVPERFNREAKKEENTVEADIEDKKSWPRIKNSRRRAFSRQQLMKGRKKMTCKKWVAAAQTRLIGESAACNEKVGRKKLRSSAADGVYLCLECIGKRRCHGCEGKGSVHSFWAKAGFTDRVWKQRANRQCRECTKEVHAEDAKKSRAKDSEVV